MRETFGYTGKSLDNIVGQYDYGYRHYDPLAGRFTTLDPIEDGDNWYAYCGNDGINLRDPFGLCGTDSEDAVTFTASEILTMHGAEFRCGEAGLTLQNGTAEVLFSNGDRSFTATYDVESRYSEGFSISIGASKSMTTYTKEFPAGTSDEVIERSFRGVFVTAYASASTGLLLSVGGGYTFTVDKETKKIDAEGWKGPTLMCSFGLGLDLGVGLQTTAYKLTKEKEFLPNSFYNVADDMLLEGVK